MLVKVRQITNIFATIFVFLVVLLAILNFSSDPKRSSLFGYRGYTVISGSMAPTLQVGDYLVVKETPFHQLTKKAVISFQNKETIVTHRIVEQTSDGSLITRGDANSVDDLLLVTERAYLGQMFFRIPFLGYLMIWLQNPLFFSVILAFVAVRFVYLWLVKK